MNDSETKGLCIALLFLDTLIFGWPPFFLVRGASQSSKSIRIRTAIISYLTCFAGGVFLGACLLHLLAEGRETMEDYFKLVGKEDMDFPVYECVLAGGFFAIAFVEQIAHTLLHSRHQHGHDPAGAAASLAHQGSLDTKSHDQLPTSEAPGFYHNNGFQKDSGLCGVVACAHNGGAHPAAAGFPDSSPTQPGYARGESSSPPPTANGASGGPGLASPLSAVIAQHSHLKSAPVAEDHEHDAEMIKAIQALQVSPLRAFLLLSALSFHTIFDGLAVGLEDSSTGVWEMFTAICIHKSLVAVCLGLQLFLAFKSRPIMGFVWVFVFSLISPIGVGIGMILTSGKIDEEAETLSSWVLQAMATGTFLYVTVFEILKEEFTERGSVLKIFISIIGFGGMAVAKYFDRD